MISKKGLLHSINYLLYQSKFAHELINLNDKEISKLKSDKKFLSDCVTNCQKQVINLQQENNKFQKQLQCAAKGHNFVFDKVEYYAIVSFPGYVVQENKDKFQFKCSNCNLTITKTKNELTPKEKKALKDLGILEDNGKNTSTTK